MAEDQKYSLVTDKGETMAFSAGFTGKGVATYPNGDVYDGEFLNGFRQGKGKYTYGTGETVDRFEGSFLNNEKHGIGRMFYANKGEYFGNFENGARNGEGLFTYLNKDIYSGYWKNGKKHGQGTYVFHDTQSRFIGEFYEGKMITGKWKLSNGQTYEGNFKHNQPNGHGTQLNLGFWNFTNGNKVEGTYAQQIIPKVNETDKINIKLEWTQ